VSLVRIDEVRPYITRLAAATASSSESTASTITSGPNVSSLAATASYGTSPSAGTLARQGHD
jgi:hypothetical protein